MSSSGASPRSTIMCASFFQAALVVRQSHSNIECLDTVAQQEPASPHHVPYVWRAGPLNKI
jgi:hypothetical protein